ncbi:MAG TPA: Gfo/Idh/MocA family oxidoreductase [Gemmataceae bacterium]|nr:Gfo/Idh/MocA family oxidoreductase [Gemmataceae bacterium]
MPGKKNTPPKTNVGRRRFLQTSAGAAAALSLASGVHADGDNILRIGLIGCGGRGTGAAANALKADPNVRLTAMGDAFRDRLDSSLANLRGDRVLAPKIDVPRERQFVGFDAYREVIGSGVDAVLLCTPPHFRPAHLDAAVRANKHVFCEKPVAVDAPGVRRVLATCQEAGRRRLSVVSGLCWRYHGGMREAFARMHDGAVGNIVALQCSYNTGTLWHRNREQGWSDMEWQIRNWLYFTWLSGDFNVEQHIHSLDKMAWAMRDQHPLRAVGLGGRQVRTGPEFGNIFDHHSVVYEYPNGIKCFASCRQQANCAPDVSDWVMGSLGTAHLRGDNGLSRITGRNAWQYPAARARQDDMYQTEHNELFASIRRGTPINNGEYMAKSTLMAIMGRMATYTGRVISWEDALNSREDLSPPRYEWGRLPVAPVARPGITEFS